MPSFGCSESEGNQVPIKSVLSAAMTTNERIAFSLRDTEPHPPAFVPDFTAFIDFLQTGQVQMWTDAVNWPKIGGPARRG
jgi:hypothetical protein